MTKMFEQRDQGPGGMAVWAATERQGAGALENSAPENGEPELPPDEASEPPPEQSGWVASDRIQGSPRRPLSPNHSLRSPPS